MRLFGAHREFVEQPLIDEPLGELQSLERPRIDTLRKLDQPVDLILGEALRFECAQIVLLRFRINYRIFWPGVRMKLRRIFALALVAAWAFRRRTRAYWLIHTARRLLSRDILVRAFMALWLIRGPGARL